MSEQRQLRIGTILHGASGNMSAWRHPAALADATLRTNPRPVDGAAIAQLLENLQHHYGEERYRPSSLLRQKALMEKHHEQ